jgi:hypothetical protein
MGRKVLAGVLILLCIGWWTYTGLGKPPQNVLVRPAQGVVGGQVTTAQQKYTDSMTQGFLDAWAADGDPRLTPDLALTMAQASCHGLEGGIAPGLMVSVGEDQGFDPDTIEQVMIFGSSWLCRGQWPTVVTYLQGGTTT